MDELEVVRNLINQGKLNDIVKQVERETFIQSKESPEEPDLFYCFALDDICECSWEAPKYARILAEIVSDSGKYMNIRCPMCGKVEEYKRTGYWSFDAKIDETLIDYGREVKVENFVDLTEWYEG